MGVNQNGNVVLMSEIHMTYPLSTVIYPATTVRSVGVQHSKESPNHLQHQAICHRSSIVFFYSSHYRLVNQLYPLESRSILVDIDERKKFRAEYVVRQGYFTFCIRSSIGKHVSIFLNAL